jgi:hypothetical protein
MDICTPGFVVPQTTPPAVIPPVMLEGALQPVKATRAPFPDEATQLWQQALQSIVNVAAGDALDANVEPVRPAHLRPLPPGEQIAPRRRRRGSTSSISIRASA